jgi:hypothetical protein
MSLKPFIKKLKKLENLIIIANSVKSNFLIGVDKILYTEINREASAVLDKHIKETTIANDITIKKKLFNEKYVEPLIHPILEAVFSVVYPTYM